MATLATRVSLETGADRPAKGISIVEEGGST